MEELKKQGEPSRVTLGRPSVRPSTPPRVSRICRAACWDYDEEMFFLFQSFSIIVIPIFFLLFLCPSQSWRRKNVWLSSAPLLLS